MLIQIEITNACNYKCFYCSGRSMDQTHMTMDEFMKIVKILPKGDQTIRLFGEGEATLHPNFWEMSKIIFDLGYKLDIIINGTIVKADLFAKYYNTVNISIDTLDPVESAKIGRPNLPKVLRNLNALIKEMGPEKISIFTTNFGQDLTDLKSFVKIKNLMHYIQPLQNKEDYLIFYPFVSKLKGDYTYDCRFIKNDISRNYDKYDNIMPCCYIKNKSKFISIADIRSKLKRKIVPECCTGCREIFKANNILSNKSGYSEIIKNLNEK